LYTPVVSCWYFPSKQKVNVITTCFAKDNRYKWERCTIKAIFRLIYILSMGYIILYTFFLCGPITVRVYFLKTEKYPHFCRHCYPFRTYRTIQIWKAYSVLLLLLHKLYTQNNRDLILQMHLFYYLAKTAILNTHLHIFHYSIRRTSSLHYIHKLNRLC
jgi:hypothetical protein